MIAMLTCALVLVLAVTLTRWVMAVPLFRTLSMSIDCWADSVHGEEAEQS